MKDIRGRKVKFIQQDPWTIDYSPGDVTEICAISSFQDEGAAVVVQGIGRLSGRAAQIVSTESIRYLNNKKVVL